MRSEFTTSSCDLVTRAYPNELKHNLSLCDEERLKQIMQIGPNARSASLKTLS